MSQDSKGTTIILSERIIKTSGGGAMRAESGRHCLHVLCLCYQGRERHRQSSQSVKVYGG